jgi:hypothetical protein
MATPQAGTVQTFDFTTGVMLDFEPLIQQLDPYDTPLLSGYGADGGAALPMGTCFEVKVEWQDEEGLTPRTTLTAAAAAGDTTITVNFNDRARFQTDDLILVDSEYMKVTGWNANSSQLNVQRAFSGTAAAHAVGAAVVGVGQLPKEGADPQEPRSRDRDSRFNYTQIFGPYSVRVSNTENAVRKYGLTGTEFDKQVANRLRELAVACEQTVLYGVRSISTADETRSMGGFLFYITTNVDSTTTSLTESKLLDQLQAVFDAGGRVTTLVGGAQQKRNFSQFGSGNIRYEQSERVRGQVVEYYDSDFGRVSFVLDRWVRKNDLFGISREQVQLVTLRPVAFVPLAVTGDSQKGMIVGEKSLRFGRERHAFRFSALT